MKREAFLFVALTTPVAQATARKVRDRPVLFGLLSDPVDGGLVQSLPRPGGQVTGTSNMLPELSAKLLERLLELVPSLSRFAVLYNSANKGKLLEVRELQTAAKARGATLRELPARSGKDIEDSLSSLVDDQVQALVVLGDGLIVSHARLINGVVSKLPLPVVANVPVEEAIVTHSNDYEAQFQDMGAMAARILKGADLRTCRSSCPRPSNSSSTSVPREGWGSRSRHPSC